MTNSTVQVSALTTWPEILTIEQAAEYLQLHPQVVYRHVRAGTLPASRIGRTIRFKKSVLDAFLEKDAWSAVGSFLTYVERRKGAAAVLQNGANGANATYAAQAQPQSENLPEPSKRNGRFSVDVD